MQDTKYVYGSNALNYTFESAKDIHRAPAEVIELASRRHEKISKQSALFSLIRSKQVQIISFVLCACFSLSLFIFDYQAHMKISQLSNAPVTTITVQPGDTLWSLANASKPSNISTADMINYLIESNGLESASLVAGQSLMLPDTELDK